MAYNLNAYMPAWNPSQPSYQPVNSITPVNGLIRVKSPEVAMSYQLPPGSVSPPMMLESDNIFFVKTTDDSGAGTLKAYRFEEIDLGSSEVYVTKEYLDNKINELMEAINGKHPVSEPESK